MYQHIRDLREDNDKTQAQLAAYLHCSQQAYSTYELGHRDVPTDVLVRLAQYYSTSVDYILGLTDMREPYPKAKVDEGKAQKQKKE